MRSGISRERASTKAGDVGRNKLKLVLVLGDALAIALGYVVVLLAAGYPHGRAWWSTVALIATATVVGVLCIRGQGLFLARVSAVRIVELTRSTRAFALLGGSMIVIDRMVHFGFRVRYIVLAAIFSWAFFVVGRSGFRSWISVKRGRGEHQRRIILVGSDAEVARLVELFATHPELGMAVDGVAGNRDEAIRNGLGSMWLGEAEQTEGLVRQHDVSGVVVSPASLTASRLNLLIRNLQTRNVHVHLATGVAGIDAGRLRTVPMSYEPLLYVEAPSLSKAQLVVKRFFDVVVSLLVLAIAAPLLLVVALLIKAQDRGPVFFHQERVGRAGKPFRLLKFRTMRVDAEEQLARLMQENQRNGPLFKMERDPRVTRVGRLLRETSLDELPQLINVLRGEMSLVGPRPALPSEVAVFAPELRQRELVLPGITGLWQVEARDNPSFEAYRRLDLFYVENWSITMDLLIMLATVEHLVVRLVRSIGHGPDGPVADAKHAASVAESAA